MMKFIQKHKLHFIRATFVIFILGTFVGFGGYFVSGSPNDAIVKVDGEKIPLYRFLAHYQRSLAAVAPGTTLDQAARNQKRDETIRDLVTQLAYKREAEKYGIIVPDLQVRSSLAQVPAFQQDGRFSLEAYGRALAMQLKTTPEEFEEEQRGSIAFFKLRWLIQTCLVVTDQELRQAWAIRGPAFAKDQGSYVDEKTKQKKTRTPQELHAIFRQRMLEEKAYWVFNQWLTQVGSQLKVKTYLNRLEGTVN